MPGGQRVEGRGGSPGLPLSGATAAVVFVALVVAELLVAELVGDELAPVEAVELVAVALGLALARGLV